MIKIMLLEDDPTMLSLLETLLQLEGYQTNKISEIENFTDEVKAFMPDLILMDVFLSNGYDGRELLKLITEDESLSSVKILMSSGSDLEKESLILGADDFIIKPYMPIELTSKIRNIVSE